MRCCLDYEISQIQRGIERDIRSSKREQVAYRTAVEECSDPELKPVLKSALDYSNEQVRKKQAKMRDFINQTKCSCTIKLDKNRTSDIIKKKQKTGVKFKCHKNTTKNIRCRQCCLQEKLETAMQRRSLKSLKALCTAG